MTTEVGKQCAACGKSETEEAPLLFCGRCQGKCYCGKECQQSDWPSHKSKCVRLGIANLLQAIQTNDLDMVQKLSRKAEVVKGIRGDFTRPIFACFPDNLQAMEILLNSGHVDTEVQDSDGDTPLFYAASRRDGLPWILLEHGANINAATYDMMRVFTPLVMAARDGNYETTKFLLEQGANPRPAINVVGTMCGGIVLEGESFEEATERMDRVKQLLQEYA